MLAKHLASRLAQTLVAAVAALTLAAPSQAAIIQGNWDPDFGAPLAGLGFRGTANFYVPDACLSSSSFAVIQNGFGCASGPGLASSVYVQSASIQFYNFSQGLNAPALATLIFVDAITPKTPADVAKVQGVLIEPVALEDPLGPQKVVGAFTDYFGAQFLLQPDVDAILASLGLLFPVDTSTDFYLAFGDVIYTPNPPGCEECAGAEFGLQALNGQAAAIYEGPFGTFTGDFTKTFMATGDCPGVGCTNSNPAATTFAAVPEPGSMALVLAAALGAGAAIRRRRNSVKS